MDILLPLTFAVFQVRPFLVTPSLLQTDRSPTFLYLSQSKVLIRTTSSTGAVLHHTDHRLRIHLSTLRL